MSLRLAVATEDSGTPLKQSIGRASRLEVSGVRLNTRTELNVESTTETAVRQICHYVAERQMTVAGLICPTRHALYDSEFMEPRLNVIRKSMSLARIMKTPELIVRCGPIPDPETPEVATDEMAVPIDESANPFSFESAISPKTPAPASEFATLCDILNDLTRHGNHVGCTITLQLPEFHSVAIQSLFDHVKAGPLKLAFDPATAIMTGAKVDNTYRSLYQHVGYVRARDAVRNLDGAGTEVRVGAGVVSWDEFIPTLVEAEYSGWICVERTGGERRFEDVTQGVSELKALIPQTGD